MYYRPFNRSMGLRIIDEFLNDIQALIKNTLTDWYINSLTEACKRYSLHALLGSTHGLFTSDSCCRLARHDRYITYNKIIKNCWIIRGTCSLTIIIFSIPLIKKGCSRTEYSPRTCKHLKMLLKKNNHLIGWGSVAPLNSPQPISFMIFNSILILEIFFVCFNIWDKLFHVQSVSIGLTTVENPGEGAYF